MKKTWIIVLLIAVLAGIGLVAASCSRFPQLLPVQADKGTPTAALPATGSTAVIEIAPTQGGPGSRITVAGRGWQPGDTVFIRLENPDTGETPGLDQASAIVTDAGEFSAKFTYPSDSRWANLPRVSIIVSDPTRDLRVSAQFALTGAALPTLTSTGLPTAASPTATAAGAALTATQAPPTATRPAPTATRVPPTATPAPTMTQAPATATSLPPTATPVVITHWRGEYYANLDLTGQPVAVRDDWSIDFSWGSGAPASGVPANGFSARWTRTLDFEAGTYRFYLSVDDGARLWVDGRLLIDEWRDSSAREVTTEIALGAGSHALRLEYYERTGQARAQLRWERLTTVSYPDWKGEYWANLNLAGAVVLTRNDRILRFDWGSTAPAAGLPADGFSARWTRQAAFAPGIYRLFAQADDGVRVYVDGRLVLNEWHDGRTTEPYTADLELTGTHTVVVEYYERTGGAFVSFWWDQVPPLPLIDPRPGVPLPGKKITPIPPLPLPSEATPAAPAARGHPHPTAERQAQRSAAAAGPGGLGRKQEGHRTR